MLPIAENKFDFSHALVRELAWALLSESLVNVEAANYSDLAWSGVELEKLHQWLSELDENPQDLEAFVKAEKDRRLGARFERLIEFWLMHTRRYELLHRRLQWGDSTRTLGEFDFIVRCNETGRVEHWEVAAKFYLGIARNSEDGLFWIGPGRQDSLPRKLGHLNDQQLQQRLHPAATVFLKSKGLEVDVTRAILRGRKFYPLSSSTDECEEAAQKYDSENIWCDWKQWTGLNVSRSCELHREHWLDPRPGWPGPELTDRGPTSESGPVCALARNGDKILRVFLVPDGWFEDISLPGPGS
jgi:hypothetical protein